MAKISIIIPVYNVSQYIKRCAYSLFGQTVKDDIEFIFVDDCSPDNSMDILEQVINEYPERRSQVRILSHGYNRGLAAARKTGMEIAEGEYILHCDSDDWMAFDMCEQMMECAAKNDADVVFCDYVGVYNKKQIVYKQYPGETADECVVKLLNGTLHNGVWNKMIRRRLYENLEFLWTEGVNMWEDVSVIPRLLYFSKKISYIQKPLYFYNQINLGSYTKQKSDSIAKQMDGAAQIVLDFYEKKGTSRACVCMFKQRVLLSLMKITRSESRKYYKGKYLDSKCSEGIMIPLSKLDSILFRLYVNNFDKLADWIINLKEKYKYLIR